MPHSPGPHLAADLSPSVRGRAVPSSPKGTQVALASPTLSLPSTKASRAAPSSPAQEPQLQESGPHTSTSAGLGCSADGAAAAAAGLFSPEATRQEHKLEAEVYVLSDIWKVFEQVVKQVTILHNMFLTECLLHPSSVPIHRSKVLFVHDMQKMLH